MKTLLVDTDSMQFDNVKIDIIDPILTQEDFKPQTIGSAGIDLRSTRPSFMVPPMQRVSLPAGFRIEIPVGFVGIMVPRSSTGIKGLWLSNIVGVIDSDYPGEITIPIVNMSDNPLKIDQRNRIAQLMIIPHWYYNSIEFTSDLSDTHRGSGGFGSSGVN